MKIRTDFVTNSSSSSYICIGIVNDCEDLRNYMREEYGKFGIRILDENLVAGIEIINDNSFDYDCAKECIEDSEGGIDPDSKYLIAEFIEYTTEGDTEGDDAFLYNILENTEYFRKIYEEK